MIKRKEMISVYMDGEASEFESASVLKHIKQEPLLERCWEGYHLIGDAMRNQVSATVSAAFTQRLAQSLENEINPFASQPMPGRRANETAGFALAASVSAVALVGLLQFGQPAMLASANNQYETDIQNQHLALAKDSSLVAMETVSPVEMDNQALAYASFDTDYSNTTDMTLAANVESSVYDYLVNYSQYAVAAPLEGSAPTVSLLSYRMD
jgi:sigma-E factor negative regulatory protein RseA